MNEDMALRDWYKQYLTGYDFNAESKTEDCEKFYRDLSKRYDKCMVDMSYEAPVATADILCKYMEQFGYNKDVCILDFGCGTGLVGEELNRRGYNNIDGVDLCAEMVEKAKEKGVYRTLTQGEMASEGCEKLGVGADQYDAAICVGVMSMGQVKGKGFDDFIHVLKLGGLACFTVRNIVAEDPAYGYGEKMEELCSAKKWKLLEKKVGPYLIDDGCCIFCFQKLKTINRNY
ncbi:methyltransferase-like protein 27 [Dendronephthya gigantea]|uniref:methyltransferase-like protein 27 n=1 Tax=Dendronephthya gigantea TaxID=151771 RepID=UPI00106A2A7E|nr:methyltransferase-like protein 27 [Dendronephthya gigantea]